MKNQAPDVNKKTVVPVSLGTYALMQFTTAWKMILCGSIAIGNDRDGKEPWWFCQGRNLLTVFFFLTFLAEMYNKHQIANFRSETLEKEQAKNTRAAAIDTIVEENSFEITKTNVIKLDKDLNSIARHEITWTVGEGQNERHIRAMFKLFNQLRREGEPAPAVPGQFKTKYKVLPNSTDASDMLSKIRVMEFLILPASVAGSIIASLLNLSPEYRKIFIFSYTVISWMLNLLDTYMANDIKQKYNMEGFSYLYPNDDDYWRFPPTCIGAGVKKKTLLFPDNRVFRDMFAYIRDGEEYIREIKKDANRINKLTPKTHKKLFGFKERIIKIPDNFDEKKIICYQTPNQTYL